MTSGDSLCSSGPAVCVDVSVITGKKAGCPSWPGPLGLRSHRQRKQHRKLQMKRSVVFDEDSVMKKKFDVTLFCVKQSPCQAMKVKTY